MKIKVFGFEGNFKKKYGILGLKYSLEYLAYDSIMI
jgi:hypothetical protein